MTIRCSLARPAGLLGCLQQDQTLGGIYFLDIDLKAEINGITLGAEIRKLDPEAVLIFVTTHDELVMDTFRLKLSAPRIQLITGDSFRFIPKNDIYFVESQKNLHKLSVHMRAEVFTTAMPLKEIAKQLGDGFLFCRRGCLINPNHVVRLDPASRLIYFDNKESRTSSHRAWKELTEGFRHKM